jgi:hypothetical protein
MEDIKDQAFPDVTIACDDTYITESTIDMYGNPLPPGVYQPVSQWFLVVSIQLLTTYR